MTAKLKQLQNLVPNPDWASLPLFDRSGWTRVRFGDVVENLNETERSPAEAGIDRFIGMEHLEPGSLHVREWGNVADGTTFTRRCRSGQVLFGKRRAYQRKVAVAEFDAVVSGDIYVLAPKDDRLIPELLPFLCLSERFFQHAVGTSAGSLSPRTNWSSLASFEFDLPPIDQQRRIAEILWTVDHMIVVHRQLTPDTLNYEKAYLKDRLGSDPAKMPMARLGDLAEFITSGPRGWADYYSDAGALFIRSQNIRNQVLEFTDLQRVSPPESAEGTRTRTKAGDVVITATGNSVGNVAYIPSDLEDAYVSQHVALVRLKYPPMHRVISAFLSPNGPGSDQIKRAQYGLKPGLSLIDIRNFQIPILPRSELEAITATISHFDNAKATLERQVCRSTELQTHLINSIVDTYDIH